jgi:peptidylprolyl isomerase
VRKTLPVVLTLAVSAALLLAGCTNSSTDANCKPVASGSVSDSVKVTGKTSVAPTVKFKAPLKSTSSQRTVITNGKGAVATTNRTVDVALVLYNGATGKELQSTGYGKTATIPLTVGDQSMIPGLTGLVKCATAGSRIVYTAPAKTALGQVDPSSLQMKSTDTIVIVADVRDLQPTKADGKAQTPKAGFPTVSLAASGKPTITIPKGKQPPADTEFEVLKKGSGATVKATDIVTLQYQGVIWDTGKVFDQSWGKKPLTNAANGFVPGFNKALAGQTVGSQVLVVIPPKDGYGSDGQPSAGIKGTDTIVFVIDILKSQAAS